MSDKMTPPNHEEELHRIRTAGSVNISPELFEQLYLSPQNAVKGDLRLTFSNPTPVALIGFLMSTTPLCMVLLGWRGAGALGAANIGTYFFFGGMLMLLGGIGEFFLGNAFPTVVFLSFSALFSTLGATLVPWFNAYGAYDPANPAAGEMQPAFFATFGFFLVAMTMLSFIYSIAAMRTNVVFLTIFILLIPTFGAFAGAFFQLAEGHAVEGTKLQHVTGGLLLLVSLLGWYIFAALVLLGVDFPIALPLGDLSTIVKGASDRAKAKKQH